jgi:hypothetical protein
MHFHLPKPLHGWREFAGEVGIIVLGVLIALAAEQAVENARLQSQTDELRASMRDELANDRARWEIIHREYPCAVKTLNALDVWAETAPPRTRITQIRGVDLWNTHVSSWEIARSSPAAAHIPLHERDTLADLYQALDRQQRVIAIAQDDMRHVRALAETADVPDSRNALRLADAEARAVLRQIENNFGYLERRFDSLGVKPDGRGLSTLDATRLPCGEVRS